MYLFIFSLTSSLSEFILFVYLPITSITLLPISIVCPMNKSMTYVLVSFIAIKIGEQRDVAILTKSAGPSDGPARVTMTTPSKKKVEVPVKLVPEGYIAQVVPFELGPHKVDVAYGSSPVPKSPFTVDVVPEGAGKVKAFGPGLTGGKAFEPATFTIDTRECTSPGELGINVDGPMECQIDVKENPDGTVNVSYMPEKPGNYNIDVTYGGIQIPKSPFKPKIEPGKPTKDLSGVKVFGPGVDKAGNEWHLHGTNIYQCMMELSPLVRYYLL